MAGEKATIDTSGGVDWNRRREVNEERMEQREEGREGGREEGSRENSISDSSNPVIWQSGDGAGAGAEAEAETARSKGRGKAGVCHPDTSSSSLEMTI